MSNRAYQEQCLQPGATGEVYQEQCQRPGITGQVYQEDCRQLGTRMISSCPYTISPYVWGWASEGSADGTCKLIVGNDIGGQHPESFFDSIDLKFFQGLSKRAGQADRSR